MKFKSFQRTGLWVALLSSITAGQARAELPPEAQAAVKKGIIAAKEQEWMIAIQSFQEARKSAPNAPEVLYNLALAESKVPGRELRAVCWFEAYLAAVPNADKAPLIRDQIAGLEIRSEGNARKIIELLKQMAGKFPANDAQNVNIRVAQVLVRAGDLDGALAVVQTMPNDQQDSGRKSVVDALATKKSFDDAAKVASQISYDRDYVTTRSDAYASIAQSQMEAGLFGEARQSVNAMTPLPSHVRMLTMLAQAQSKAGKKEEAHATLADAKALAAGINKEQNHLYAMFLLAEMQGKLGWHDEAQVSLKEIDSLIPSTASENNNSEIHSALLAHVGAEDIAGAQVLLPRLIDVNGFAYRTDASQNIAKKINEIYIAEDEAFQNLVKTGDLDGAETLASRMKSRTLKSMAYLTLANKKKDDTIALARFQQRAEGTFTDTPTPLLPIFKIIIANHIAQVADLAGDLSGARHWRAKVLNLDNFKVALQNPTAYFQDRIFYDNYFQSGDLCCNILRQAIASGDKATVEEAIKVIKGVLPQLKKEDQVKLVIPAVWFFWNEKDFNSDRSFLDAIPDATVRQQAWDMHHELHFSQQVNSGDLSGAGKSLAQISSAPSGEQGLRKSSKDDLWAKLANRQAAKGDWTAANQTLLNLTNADNGQRGLSELSQTQADAGNWPVASKTIGTITNSVHRQTALNHLSYAKAAGGEKPENPGKTWEENRDKIASQPSGQQRLNAYWQFCGFPNVEQLAAQRTMAPAYLAELIAIEKPHDRADSYAELACLRLGLIELNRASRAVVLSATQADPSPYYYSLGSVLDHSSAADILALASGRFKDEMLTRAFQRLVQDGNFTAAEKINEQIAKNAGKPTLVDVQNWIRLGNLTNAEQSATGLTGYDADKANAALADGWSVAGNIAAARADYERITNDIYQNDYARSSAAFSLVKGWVKAGDLTAAKAFDIQFWKDWQNESTRANLLTAIGTGGDPNWALARVKTISYGPNVDTVRIAVTPIVAAHSNDLALAKTVFKTLQTYQQYSFVNGIIMAGNLPMAWKLAPEINDDYYRGQELGAIAMAFARTNDFATAEKIINGLESNSARFGNRAAIANIQAAAGNLEGARATLLAARKLDLRTSPNLDLDSWAGSIAAALPDDNAKLAEAKKIRDPYWRDITFQSIATGAIHKNQATVIAALSTITNDLARSFAAYNALLTATNLPECLAYLDLVSEPGFQTMGLNWVLNKAISRMEVSPVLPRILALPDGAAKAYLLGDILRAEVFLGLDPKSPSLLPGAIKAANAMPANVWQVLLLSDLARLAAQLDPEQGRALGDLVATKTQSLTNGDAVIWKQFLADAAAAKTVAVQTSIAANPVNEKAKTWCDFVTDSYLTVKGQSLSVNLSKPIHTDFNNTLASLANSVPENENNRSWRIYYLYEEQANELLEKLKNIRAMRNLIQ